MIDSSYHSTEILCATSRLQVSGGYIATRQHSGCKAGTRQKVKEKIQPSQKLLLCFFLIRIVQVAMSQVLRNLCRVPPTLSLAE